MHLLVNHSKDVVQNRLVSELYKEDLFGDLLYEDDGIKAEREKCEKLLGMYMRAWGCRHNLLLTGLPTQAPTGKLPRLSERFCRRVSVYFYYGKTLDKSDLGVGLRLLLQWQLAFMRLSTAVSTFDSPIRLTLGRRRRLNKFVHVISVMAFLFRLRCCHVSHI